MKQMFLLLQQVIEELRALREESQRGRDLERPMTREEAAAYLSVNKETVARWTREGLIAAAKMGDGDERAGYRYSREDLDYFALKRRRLEPIRRGNGSGVLKVRQ